MWSVGAGDLDKDEPVKAGDHGCDIFRYVVRYLDGRAKSFAPATAPAGRRVIDEMPADTYS